MHNGKLYLTYGMVLCLVTLTDLQTRRAGLSASAELLLSFCNAVALSTNYTNAKKILYFTYLSLLQWRRRVVKYRGSGSVRSNNQTVSDYTLCQWFPNTDFFNFPVRDSLQAPRKVSFTFRFRHKSFILDDVKLEDLTNNSFQWKKWHFRLSKTYIIFRVESRPHQWK